MPTAEDSCSNKQLQYLVSVLRVHKYRAPDCRGRWRTLFVGSVAPVMPTVLGVAPRILENFKQTALRTGTSRYRNTQTHSNPACPDCRRQTVTIQLDPEGTKKITKCEGRVEGLPVGTAAQTLQKAAPPSDWACACLWGLLGRGLPMCTASLTFSNPTFCPHSVFTCFVWI